MAVGGQFSNLLEVLQPAFGERVTALTNDRAKIYNLLALAPRPFDGKHLIEAVTASYPGSFKFLGPNAASLPSPSSNTVVWTYITHAYAYASVRVDWDLIEQSSGGPHSFVSAWTIQMERSMADTLLQLERISCGDGSGVLNPLASITSIGTVTTANWVATVHLWDAPKFRVGMQVEVMAGTYDATNWKNATKRDTPSQGFYTISDVAPDPGAGTCVVTLAEASPGTNPPVNGDYFVVDEAIAIDATPSTTNATNEPLGLDAHISDSALFLQPNTKAGFQADGTHQGIAVSSNGWWKSPTVDTGSATQYLKPDHFEELAVLMNVFSSTEANQTSFYLAHPHQIRKYREQLVPGERYMVMGETPSLPSGTKSSLKEDTYLTFADTPLVGSRFCRADRAYAVNTRDMKRYQLVPFRFKQTHQDFGGRPADQQDAQAIMQIGTTDRTSSGLIKDLKKL